MSEARVQLIRRFSAAAVLAEQLEAKLANGEEIDIAEHAQLCSSLVRLSARIGIDRRARKIVPTLDQYMLGPADAGTWTIDRALRDPNLLGAALGDYGPWKTWLAVLRSAFGLPLGEEERIAFHAVAGDRATQASASASFGQSLAGEEASPGWLPHWRYTRVASFHIAYRQAKSVMF